MQYIKPMSSVKGLRKCNQPSPDCQSASVAAFVFSVSSAPVSHHPPPHLETHLPPLLLQTPAEVNSHFCPSLYCLSELRIVSAHSGNIRTTKVTVNLSNLRRSGIR